MIRVLIADDQALVRTGFRVILNAEPDLEVVGEAADGRETIEVVRTQRPDVVLMDIRMPNLDGIEATRRLAAAAHAPRVLILTTFDLDQYVYEALRAGERLPTQRRHCRRTATGSAGRRRRRGAALALDHTPPDRRLRTPPTSQRTPRSARRAHAAGTRSATPHRPRPLQP